MEELMRKRRAEADAAYEACWDGGRGSHHPDFDPFATLPPPKAGGKAPPAPRADRVTEQLYAAIVADDVAAVYAALEGGADAGFEFGAAYRCPEGYTPLMVAAHRGRLECAKALLRAGADPNHVTAGGDLALFWAIDGGVPMVQLFVEYGADLDAVSPKNWTPLQYAIAKGKYGPTEEAGIYPEDVLRFYGATKGGGGDGVYGPPSRAAPRSPRNSFNPPAEDFTRERGTYQDPAAHP